MLPLEAPSLEALALTENLAHRAQRPQATAGLTRLGAAAVPALLAAIPAALAVADGPLLRRLAQAAGRVRTAHSRQLLLHLAQGDNLFGRAAALHALGNFAPDPADAPALHAIVQDELRLAQHLLHGQAQLAAAHPALAAALDYELGRLQARLFDLLVQLYPAQAIADARRNVAQAGRERQANALEMLDNLIPRQIYQGLQALLDPEPLAHKLRVFDDLLGPPPATPAAATLATRGTAAFTDWTVALALAAWQPTPTSLGALPGHLLSANPLVRESAHAARRVLALHHPALYAALPRLHASLAYMAHPSAHHHDAPARISAADRVRILKSTALFAETPENVLSAIVPIMNEVEYAEPHQIFAQGDTGSSLFIVYEGQVGIYHGERLLATFGKGDFFGELALLDAEPRSATARTLGPALAFRLDQEDFYDVMEERPEVLRNILRVLCQRLRRQNEKAAA